MRGLADGFDAAFLNDDGDGVARHLLHRVQMEDGLAVHIGRYAVITEALALAAAFDDRVVARAETVGDRCICLSWSGTLRQFPGRGAALLPVPVSGKLRRHLWVETEANRGIRITAVTDWAGLADSAGIARDGLAEALGAAHYVYRPLGELASGRGQLSEPLGNSGMDADAHYIARLNARAFSGFEFSRREWWLRLLAQVPDARFTLDRSSAGEGRRAVLWRMQGHVAGRRVSLPGSSMLDDDGDESVMFDELALAATAHRPFFEV